MGEEHRQLVSFLRSSYHSSRSTLELLSLVVLAIWSLLGAIRLSHETQFSIFDRYIASQWLVTYEWGFVRRGLPGQLMLVFGDARPLALEVMAWMSPAVGVGTMIWVSIKVASLQPRARRLVTLVICITSPLSLSLFFHDIGRVDGLIIGLLATNIFIARVRRDVLWFALTLAVGTTAILFSEFAFVFLIPLVLVATQVRGLSCRGLGLTLCAIFAGIGLYSLASPLSKSALDTILSSKDHVVEADGAAFWLTASLRESANLSLSLGPWLVLSLFLYTVLFTLPVIALACGAGFGRVWWLAAAWLLAVAFVASIVALDARRFFGLALMTLLILTVLRFQTHVLRTRTLNTRSDGYRVGVILCLLLAVLLQSLPVTHVSSEFWINSLTFLA